MNARRARPKAKRLPLESGSVSAESHIMADARMSIGALAKTTGIPVETIRTWEARYGYPVPERKPSGHRVYSVATATRLSRIAAALSGGHRAGDVVPASDEMLDQLLPHGSSYPKGLALVGSSEGALLVGQVWTALQRFDGDALLSTMRAEWAARGPLAFLEGWLGPLTVEVGEAWREGRLGVGHEHFYSERVEDLLRTVRIPFDARALGPAIIFSTLPGERHVLGLHMAALVSATAGCRVLVLGRETPLADLVLASLENRVRAVAISVSCASKGPSVAANLSRLRSQLSPRVALVVGGDGAPKALDGVRVLRSLSELEQMCTELSRGRRS